MKGVIVQVGEPKSIVLFNNGKIGAIPTPADCHVGMVVAVNYNNKFKITVIALAAVLLVGLGIVLGRFLMSPPPAEGSGMEQGSGMMMDGHHGRGMGLDQVITIKQAKTLPDDAFVIVQGKIEQTVGKNRYILNDGTDTISVEIDKKLWVNGLSPDSNDVFVIYGEIDREKNRIEIDAQGVVKK